ncbi:hypothetical protein PTTG_25822 [Puccinia triticina 1-1 BBBD Race 1]|uniref:Uncharacterized protein n=2 Tax=Puccinia triticina TaxID=208348 RepID=A0A180H0L6_PUCT1|nr:uncharacterized protein PtA15_10A355 [Puccinia triticina]OAV98149.1 hypothetical protein PTTG_25822 [Puccinia triticina 1-1 BBBD Race 1]WAQ88932.1 hypothetical protein PtA15_10A355 [Puccinia triticina]WAR58985.1 hypothetical protein PtB15_10B327 [Puccinia triticina]
MSIVGSQTTNYTTGSGPSNMTSSSTTQTPPAASLAMKAKMAELNADTARAVQYLLGFQIGSIIVSRQEIIVCE